MRRRVLMAGVMSALLLLAACSSDDGDAGGADAATDATTDTTVAIALDEAASVEAPAEVEDVYEVPDPLPPGEPGDVIQVEALGGVLGASDATWWRVLYHSRSLQDEDIAVSGIVIRPAGEPPAGGFPVVTWAHGTTGTADICAPSTAAEPRVPSLDSLLDAGYVVVATDYEGLGTPGLHPYLLGASEGRGVLDAARAAARLEGVDAGPEVVVWGHSQGGHAALFAGEIAAAYAPDLDVRGVVAMAPAGDLSIIGPAALGSASLFPFAFMALGTWPESYPELDLAALFAPAALERLRLLDQECTDGVFGAFADLTLDQLLVTTAPLDVPPVRQLFADNTIGARPYGSVPALVVHGTEDSLIPVALSELLVPAMCTGGADAELRTYPASHSSIPEVSSSDVLGWTADRFAAQPVTGGCGSP
jgi:pimeloyl-ACP methyl ester carboxylesterase